MRLWLWRQTGSAKKAAIDQATKQKAMATPWLFACGEARGAAAD